MKRRDFVKTMAAAGAMAVSGCGGTSDWAQWLPQDSTDPEATPPNIVFMLVDEMRYPVHFPAGVANADEFIARFMPNLSRHLWKDGVKFANYRVAAGACTPSRGVMLTGLYSHQSGVLTTITGSGPGGDEPPSLSPEYPTYGSLLKKAGYTTPYFGKFHVSIDAPYKEDQCPFNPQNYLAPWGFDDCMCPDPGGTQGQGNSGDGLVTGDAEIADLATAYFAARKVGDQPFCATVSFVNPHDYQFFWGGTEPTEYQALFDAAGQEPLVPFDPRIQSEANPPAQGFPELPSNWESFDQIEANKPKTQAMYNEGQQCVFGSASFDRSSTDFELQGSRVAMGHVYKGVAPFSYWQRGQDSYAQVLGMVDQHIGRVLDAIPEDVRANTVVVFTSDHGDHVGSHGLLAGKMGTIYDEVLRVPLIVRDYTGRFATAASVERPQLASSVDLLRLLVTLGHNGSTDWIAGDLAELYASRHDLLSVVQSPRAPGRDYAVYTTDEFVNHILNYNAAPTHIAGVMTATEKLGIYNYWRPGTVNPVALGRELEYYDRRTPGGKQELDNRPDDPRAQELLRIWEQELLPQEVRRPLPESLRAVQQETYQTYLNFVSRRDDVSLANLRERIAFNMGLDRIP